MRVWGYVPVLLCRDDEAMVLLKAQGVYHGFRL